MFQIELSPQEQDVLGQILRNALAMLETEIRHTDHLEFREILKQRREVLKGLLDRMPEPAVFSG